MLSEIVTALTAANQATNLVKELREIDQSVDAAAYKLKLADLTTALADTKIALAAAKEELANKDSEITELKIRLRNTSQGEACPICRVGQLQVKNVREHPTFGVLGHQERTLSCDNADCTHSEKRRHDPSGNS